MGWFYANRWSAELTDLTRSLREELYVEPYDKIDWSRAPNNIAAVDLYTPHTKLMDAANGEYRGGAFQRNVNFDLSLILLQSFFDNTRNSSDLKAGFGARLLTKSFDKCDMKTKTPNTWILDR